MAFCAFPNQPGSMRFGAAPPVGPYAWAPPAWAVAEPGALCPPGVAFPHMPLLGTTKMPMPRIPAMPPMTPRPTPVAPLQATWASVRMPVPDSAQSPQRPPLSPLRTSMSMQLPQPQQKQHQQQHQQQQQQQQPPPRSQRAPPPQRQTVVQQQPLGLWQVEPHSHSQLPLPGSAATTLATTCVTATHRDTVVMAAGVPAPPGVTAVVGAFTTAAFADSLNSSMVLEQQPPPRPPLPQQQTVVRQQPLGQVQAEPHSHPQMQLLAAAATTPATTCVTATPRGTVVMAAGVTGVPAPPGLTAVEGAVTTAAFEDSLNSSMMLEQSPPCPPLPKQQTVLQQKPLGQVQAEPHSHPQLQLPAAAATTPATRCVTATPRGTVVMAAGVPAPPGVTAVVGAFTTATFDDSLNSSMVLEQQSPQRPPLPQQPTVVQQQPLGQMQTEPHSHPQLQLPAAAATMPPTAPLGTVTVASGVPAPPGVTAVVGAFTTAAFEDSLNSSMVLEPIEAAAASPFSPPTPALPPGLGDQAPVPPVPTTPPPPAVPAPLCQSARYVPPVLPHTVQLADGVERLEPELVHDLMRSGACVLVDVRDRDQAAGLVKGARHVPACDDTPFPKKAAALVRQFADDALVVFMCQYSAHRAPQCANWYRAATRASQRVAILEGGFRCWEGRGLPVVSPAPGTTQVMSAPAADEFALKQGVNFVSNVAPRWAAEHVIPAAGMGA